MKNTKHYAMIVALAISGLPVSLSIRVAPKRRIDALPLPRIVKHMTDADHIAMWRAESKRVARRARNVKNAKGTAK